jgi:5'-deoxynucleotidase YfbR-like HD superfamily hydrolase
VVPTVQHQNVAEHSYHVAHIALWVAREHQQYSDGSLDAALMYYALIHDETEAITGDIPSTAGEHHVPGKSSVFEKTHNHGATSAPDEVRSILKIADLLEALLFVKEEIQLGNFNLRTVQESISKRLHLALRGFSRKPRTPHDYSVYDASLFISDFLSDYAPATHPADEEP